MGLLELIHREASGKRRSLVVVGALAGVANMVIITGECPFTRHETS